MSKCRFRGSVSAVMVLMCGLLFSCSSQPTQSINSGVSLVMQTRLFDDQVQSGEIEGVVLSAALSDSDLTVVVSAFDAYAVSRSNLTEVARNPLLLLSNLDAINVEHARLERAYANLYGVIERNIDLYDAGHQGRLRRWHEQVVQLDARYREFVQIVHTQVAEDARTAATLELLQTVAQIALIAA